MASERLRHLLLGDRARHVLLGDWSRPVRDPIDILRLCLLAGAVVASVMGDTEAAVRLALTFLASLAPRRLDVPRPFDLLFVLGMMFQGFGNAFELFQDYDWYDKVVHFVLPLATAPLVYILLLRLRVVPDPASETTEHHDLGLLLVTFSLGVTVGVIYEIYEWFAVNALGAGLDVGYDDTIGDLVDNSVASLAGGALLVVWSQLGWSSSRRLPERRLPH